MKKDKEKVKYESPLTKKTQVNLESGFMSSASIFEEENKHDEGLSTEEHGFANPGAEWEGDYGKSEWD